MPGSVRRNRQNSEHLKTQVFDSLKPTIEHCGIVTKGPKPWNLWTVEGPKFLHDEALGRRNAADAAETIA